MKLEFGKYTEITNFAKKVNPEMFDHYLKVYICPDTLNWWLSMIQEGLDEDYNKAPGMFLIERANPDYPDEDRCDQKYLTDQVVKQVLEDWDGCCWDNHQTVSLEEAVELISDVFGINSEE